MKEGGLFDCANCAGVKFRLRGEGAGATLGLVQMVSCPGCGERIPVDDDTAEGTLIRHDGALFRLTREFGAFALEPAREG